MENENPNQQNLESSDQLVSLNSDSNENQFIGGKIVSEENKDLSNNESGKIPFARFFRSKNRKKAIIFILVPILLFLLGQSGPLWVAVMLMSPVLLAFIIYGIVIFFRKDAPEQVLNLNSPDSTLNTGGKKSYKHGMVMLIIGLVLLLLAYFAVQNVRTSTGYSGSEGEIVAFPLMFSGAVFIILSIVSIAISFFTNLFRD